MIGDDEHGWDDNGIFNFEGGCYAKVINLDKESEPDIYNAIKRNALLENVTLDENGKIDFDDKSVTENTRVSYPIDHIGKNRASDIGSSGSEKCNFPVSRCVWSASAGIDSYTGADRILFLVRIYSKTCRYGAWYHRADTDILSMFWTGIS